MIILDEGTDKNPSEKEFINVKRTHMNRRKRRALKIMLLGKGLTSLFITRTAPIRISGRERLGAEERWPHIS